MCQNFDDPAAMTPDQRRHEIAAILARTVSHQYRQRVESLAHVRRRMEDVVHRTLAKVAGGFLGMWMSL